MEKILLNLLKLQNQLRILHWQTDSFSQHKAFGKAYSDLDELLDSLVEVHQGKYGNIKLSSGSKIELLNFNEVKPEKILKEATEYLSSSFIEEVDPEKDTDSLNIRDEMLSVLNKLKYLLTLK